MFLYNFELSYMENYYFFAKALFALGVVFFITCVIGCIRYKRDSKKWNEWSSLVCVGSIVFIIALSVCMLIRPMIDEIDNQVLSVEASKTTETYFESPM